MLMVVPSPERAKTVRAANETAVIRVGVVLSILCKDPESPYTAGEIDCPMCQRGKFRYFRGAVTLHGSCDWNGCGWKVML
jgi:hypothetical protein